MRKLFAALILTFSVAALLPAGAAGAADAATTRTAVRSGEASDFVARINSLRASKGLGPLQTYGELAGVAQRWAEHMAAAGAISHNGNLPNDVSAPWTTLGENVGAGTDVDGLMQAFIASPAHYRNLVDGDYGYVGVGVVWGSDGRLYTCHVFMGMSDTPPAPGADGGTPPASTTGSPGSSGGSTAAAPASSGRHHTAAAAPPPPPPPQGPAEPARVAAVVAALHTLG